MRKPYLRTQDIFNKVFENRTNTLKAAVGPHSTQDYINAVFDSSEDALRINVVGGEVPEGDYILASEKGASNGVTPLDADAKVPSENLQKAGNGAAQTGVVYGTTTYGIQFNNGRGQVDLAKDAEIDSRSNQYKPVVPSNLNYAVTAALTDANKISLSAAQKTSAQETLGVAPATLHLDSAPTTSTVGAFGQLAINDASADKAMYICKGATTVNDTTSYVWNKVMQANVEGLTAQTMTVDIMNVLKRNSDVLISYGIPGFRTVEFGFSASGWTRLIGNNVQINLHASKISFEKVSGTLVFAEMNDNTGDFYIAGGHQQGITEIPAATTAYTLAEGCQSHIPDSASTYTLPAVTDNTRTHECILTVRFSSSVLTYSFEDATGNAIVPLPLAGTIADGSVVCFRCTWETLLNQWVIMPVMLGTYTA